MKHFWIKGISILLIAGQISGQTMVVNAEETEIFSEESIQESETLLETEIVQETETALGTQQLSNMETEKETLESQFSESELHRQADYRENSWRYSEGLWTGGVYYLQEDLYKNAWGYENGSYVNSYGDVIEGALAKGIDVSTFNGNIDWEKVRSESDVDYAIIRCGYGNDYPDQDDVRWEYNASECERLGIPYGVYIYSYAMDTKEALSEAEHVLRLVQDCNLSLPIYLDLEDENYTGSLTNKEIADIAEVFCSRVQEAGYDVGIYANLNWFQNRLTDLRFNQWEKWVAQYNYCCDYEGGYGMWQCTSGGSVPGIEGNNGNVDLNFDFIDRGYKKTELEPVRNLTATASGDSKILLRWEPVNGADGYIIYRKRDDEEKFSYRYIVNKTNYTDTTALNNAYNYYRVYPYYVDRNNERILGKSEEYVFAKPGVMAVQHISAQPYGKHKVMLSWQRVEGADGYFIYRSIGDGKFSYQYMKNTTTYIDTSASAVEYNFYRIYPYYVDASGNRIMGKSEKYVFAKGILPPVTGLKVMPGTSGVTIGWNRIPEADGYIIYRQIGSQGQFSYRYMVTGTTFKDTTASASEYNFYRVYPYYIDDGSRITSTQSISYVYGKAR